MRDKNCLAAIFSSRHQSVSSGPLGMHEGFSVSGAPFFLDLVSKTPRPRGRDRPLLADLGGTGDSQRDTRESTRANRSQLIGQKKGT